MPASNLTPLQQALVALSGAMASRDGEAVREALRGAVEIGDPVAVEEAILQGYLFLGYPAALNTLGLWRDLSGRKAGEPVAWDPDLWEERGQDVCRTVYAGQYDRLRRNIRALHADMEHWMVVEGYGKVLGRPGLSLRDRELCIVALLAVQRAPRQLYSHVRGALNAGASHAEVEAALEVATAWLDPAGREEARAVWDRLRTTNEER
jgi:4-carboxymuconolactone decarboxylase